MLAAVMGMYDNCEWEDPQCPVQVCLTASYHLEHLAEVPTDKDSACIWCGVDSTLPPERRILLPTLIPRTHSLISSV